MNSSNATRRAGLIIGICGGSGAGKSTVTGILAKLLNGVDVGVIEQDCYYRSLPEGRRDQDHNFDHPAALDVPLLRSHLAALKAGRPIRLPSYDFKTHRRLKKPRPFGRHRIVLVEGALVFANPRLRDLYDLRLFVDAPPDLRLARRIARDMRERGRTADFVLGQYMATVRTMHLRFIEPYRESAQFVVVNDGDLLRVHKQLKAIKGHIHKLATLR